MEKNDNMIVFRDAIKGFNKTDVTDYIEKMNINFSTTEEEYKKIVFSQKEQIEQITEKMNEYDNTNAEILKLKKEISEKQALLGSYITKNNESSSLIGVLNENIEKLQTQNKQLLSDRNVTMAKAQEIDDVIDEYNEALEKAKLYDKMSSQLGNMIIHANQDADKIIDQANINGEKILNEANLTATKIKADAEADVVFLKKEAMKRANAMIATINKNLKNMSIEYFNEVVTFSKETQDNINNMIDNIQIKSDNIQTKIATMRTSMENNVMSELDKISNPSTPSPKTEFIFDSEDIFHNENV